MLEQRGGWRVVNVRSAQWAQNPAFGKACGFEADGTFANTGAHIFVLEPGKPNCRYHRENVQEDYLVLSGRCRLLVNEEEYELETWDFAHLPSGVTHVLVGSDAPAAVLAIGHRPPDHELFYPESELARKYNAEAPEPTPDPKVAYSDVGGREPCDPPKWPLD
ncbi:MAG: cupin domain-containing protein [bacterium]|nr:cupin domain-containing protein [bacterium]